MKRIITTNLAAVALMAAADKNSGGNPVPPVPPAPAASAKGVEIFGKRTDIAIPEGKKAGAKSKYDFDGLEVNGSFGVKGKTASQFNSIIYSAEQRHAVPVKNADGTTATRVKKLKDGGTEVVDKVAKTREFSAFDVDPKTDPDGATVRIFRIK